MSGPSLPFCLSSATVTPYHTRLLRPSLVPWTRAPTTSRFEVLLHVVELPQIPMPVVWDQRGSLV